MLVGCFEKQLAVLSVIAMVRVETVLCLAFAAVLGIDHTAAAVKVLSHYSERGAMPAAAATDRVSMTVAIAR